MKILHITPDYSIDWGGPPKIIYDLCKSLALKGIDTEILTTYQDNETLYPVPEGVKLVKIKRGELANLWTGFSMGIIGFLRENLHRYDLIHIHELWHFPHFMAYLMHKNIPYVITIHGGLDKWCLSYKGFKKKIYSLIIQRKILENANMVHVLTSEGKENVEKYTGKNLKNIVIIPNGVNLSEFKDLPPEGSFKNKYPVLSDKNYILFLGRINIIKGLDILADSFGFLAKKYKNLYLVIAGPDNDGYGEKVKNRLNKHDLLNRVIFTGSLSGKDKLSAFVDAKVFVLPSYSEGFGKVIIEAMACETPVVISKTGIYKEVEENNAGIVVETTPESLYNGIKKILDNNELRKKVIENGKKMVEKYYNIDRIADMMIEVYNRIIIGNYS